MIDIPAMARCYFITVSLVALSALPLGGCVSMSPKGVDPALVQRLAQDAARQVQRCYRKPRVASAATQIVTRLRVRYTSEGQLAALPEVLWQRSVAPAAQPYAGAMAEAASLAVIRCAPIRLPAEAYAGGWDEIDFTFSPRALG